MLRRRGRPGARSSVSMYAAYRNTSCDSRFALPCMVGSVGPARDDAPGQQQIRQQRRKGAPEMTHPHPSPEPARPSPSPRRPRWPLLVSLTVSTLAYAVTQNAVVAVEAGTVVLAFFTD